MVQQIDFNNANVTEEELEARLNAFDIVLEAHEEAVTPFSQKSHHAKLGRYLCESLLDSEALEQYRVPLCFRETDDDLAVLDSMPENVLD